MAMAIVAVAHPSSSFGRAPPVHRVDLELAVASHEQIGGSGFHGGPPGRGMAQRFHAVELTNDFTTTCDDAGGTFKTEATVSNRNSRGGRSSRGAVAEPAVVAQTSRAANREAWLPGVNLPRVQVEQRRADAPQIDPADAPPRQPYGSSRK